jgi:hypothetical protein
MLIIWGFRVLYTVTGSGIFRCPRCAADRNYVLRSGRRWFTLFFIPIIPLRHVGEHVQCTVCRGAFRPEVLAVPTGAQQQAALVAGMQLAAAAMVKAGRTGAPAARQRAIESVRGTGYAGYDDAALARDVAGAAAPGQLSGDASPLAAVAAQLPPEAKEYFLAEVIRIGLADGPLAGSERDTAATIADALGMTQAQALGVISLTERAAGLS